MRSNSRPAKKRRRKNVKLRPNPEGRILVAVLLALSLGLSLCYILYDAPRWSGRLEENPYGPGDFALVDGYLTCTAGPSRRGLDVSEYQGDIDWEAVYAGGFDFVFVRIGYRGYRTGQILADDHARENLAGARAAGLDVGAYFYSQALTTQEAAEEARWCLDYLEGTALELPLVFDWEWVSREARTGAMTKGLLTDCARTFCETVQAGGYQPMLYFNTHISRDLLDLKQLQEYPRWLALYQTEMTFPYQVHFWQYTEEGSVPGIRGKVDINLMLLN